MIVVHVDYVYNFIVFVVSCFTDTKVHVIYEVLLIELNSPQLQQNCFSFLPRTAISQLVCCQPVVKNNWKFQQTFKTLFAIHFLWLFRSWGALHLANGIFLVSINFTLNEDISDQINQLIDFIIICYRFYWTWTIVSVQYLLWRRFQWTDQVGLKYIYNHNIV